MRKRCLSVLLALALCLPLAPPAAWASGEPEDEPAAEEYIQAPTPEAAQDEPAEPEPDEKSDPEPTEAPEPVPDEASEPEPTEAPAPTRAAEEPVGAGDMPAPAFDGASNEAAVYAFLTGTMGFNTAAACGILASIAKESSFDPNLSGDSGSSYGICQWHDWGSGVGRFTNLKSFCAKNGYDYTTLEGQLYFLQYELNSGYTTIRDKMRAYPNTAQGAYDAGYYWCYYFEAPGNRETVSQERGVLARDTYWPRYNNTFTVSFDADGGSAVGSMTVAAGAAIGILPASVRTGYTFGGWYSGKSGSGTRLTTQTVVTADATYYARWDANRYQATFDAQGGTVDASVKLVSFGAEYGTLPAPTRFGFLFEGWYTAPDGGEAVTSTSTVRTDGNHTLYARWKAVLSCTISYDANGGSGAPMAQKKTFGAELTLTGTQPRRAGYSFLGWAESPDAETAEYAPGGIFTDDRSVTLYAVWRHDAPTGGETPADAAEYLRGGYTGFAAEILRACVGK